MAEMPRLRENEVAQREQGCNKPKLTVAQQVAHLKAKGVKFERCDEGEAGDYLSRKCDLYEATSYRKLFSKRQGGKQDGEYVNLDFAQLIAFAELDEMLRETLFPITRHIEHYRKVALKHDISEREEESGYKIVVDYLASLTPRDRRYRESELERNSKNKYTEAAYEKYKENMPSWVFLELVPFSALIDFIRFCGVRWNDKGLEQSHYDLKKVKSVRNCTAHGSCIINTFADGANARHTTSKDTLEAVAKLELSRATKRKWMRNASVQEIAVTLVRYATIVPNCSAKKRDIERLRGFFDEVEAAGDLLPRTGPDATAAAAISFIRFLTESLHLLD